MLRQKGDRHVWSGQVLSIVTTATTGRQSCFCFSFQTVSVYISKYFSVLQKTGVLLVEIELLRKLDLF